MPWVDWFNSAVPTSDGTASSYIGSLIGSTKSSNVGHVWFDESPIPGIGMCHLATPL